MLTLALYTLLALLVGVGLFLLAAHVLPPGEQIAPPLPDEPLWRLPAGRAFGADDLAALRLPVAIRGYRFAEADLLLDRLGSELARRDAQIAELRAQLAPASGHPAGPRPQAGVNEGADEGADEDSTSASTPDS